MIKPGDKVTYTPTWEHGIVKSVSETCACVFVVFNCGGDWKNYQNYTGQNTRIMDLIEGWK